MTFGERSAALALLALASALAACAPSGSHEQSGHVTATIAEDLRFSAPCAGGQDGVVATIVGIDRPPKPPTVTLTGDPAFVVTAPPVPSPDGSTFTVNVGFQAPRDARPGDTFEGTAVVTSADGPFTPASTALHAAVMVPRFTVDRPFLDFGDVPVGEARDEALALRSTDLFDAMIAAQTTDTAPFLIPGGSVSNIGQDSTLTLRATSQQPGDFTRDLVWLAGPLAPGPGQIAAPAECSVQLKVTAHVRFVPQDAGARSDADLLIP